MGYIEKLKQFYIEKGISKSDFKCSKCFSMVKDSNLSCGAEAYVGKYYGKAIRILVVSLDIGGYAENIDERIKTIENLQYDKCNAHMKGTYTILKAILRNEINEDNPFLYYSMTNSSKCSVLDNTMNMAPRFFFDNCKEFTLEEIIVLDSSSTVV